MTISEIKKQIEKAKSELTKAEAVLGEVRDNIEKDIASLKELGVKMPDKGSLEDKEYFEKCLAASNEFLESVRKEIANDKEELEKILNQFEGDSEEKESDPF